MNELHGHRSFTDSGSHPFYGAVTHIAHGEDAGDIGLQQERITIKCPSLRVLSVAQKVGTSQQETTLVPLNHAAQPIRLRQRSNENKHGICRHALYLAGIGAEH